MLGGTTYDEDSTGVRLGTESVFFVGNKFYLDLDGCRTGYFGVTGASSVALFLFKLFFRISRFVGLCGGAAACVGVVAGY